MSLPLLCILFCYLAYSLSPLFDYQCLAGSLLLGTLCLSLKRDSYKRYALCSCSLIIFLLYLLFSRAVHHTRFIGGLETKRIVRLEGVLLEDSLDQKRKPAASNQGCMVRRWRRVGSFRIRGVQRSCSR